jgi:hypothetical protein
MHRRDMRDPDSLIWTYITVTGSPVFLARARRHLGLSGSGARQQFLPKFPGFVITTCISALPQTRATRLPS